MTGFKYECAFARAYVAMLLVPTGAALAVLLAFNSFLWNCWESGVPFAIETASEDWREIAYAVRSRVDWVRNFPRKAS